MNFVRVDDYPYVFHPNGTFLRIWDGYTKEVKTFKNKYGYIQVSLCKNGKQKSFKVHRLLATAFIPNPENKSCVDHINGIRDDNRLENLRWVTHRENMLGFRKDRGKFAIITKGSIYKTKYGWKWKFYMTGKRKSKQMKSKEDLLKFREKKLAEHQF